MGYIILIILIIISILSGAGVIPIIGLLFVSGFIFTYCIITMLNKDEHLTEIGKIALILSAMSLTYSISIMFFNVDVNQILLKAL